MPRLAVVSALLALLAIAAPAQADPVALVRTLSCVHDGDQAQRTATFEGDMRALPRARRLQMRFTLQARTPATQTWSHVAAPNFDQWVSSAPGKARYVYDKTVENLPPGDYRALV